MRKMEYVIRKQENAKDVKKVILEKIVKQGVINLAKILVTK
jgi:hypothetical protein